MKKRILSIVLALCMVMAIMPQAVFANSNEDSLPDGDLSPGRNWPGPAGYSTRTPTPSR